MSAIAIVPTPKIVEAFDGPAYVTFFLEGVRLGDARVSMAALDENHIRVCYLGSIETRLGTLSVMVELPPTEEAASHAVRDSASALRALDASSYGFDGGRVTATLDCVTGYWTVTVDGEAIAQCATQADALAVAHKQVES